LEETLPAEVFDRYVAYNKLRPFDDQSNFHFPVANLTALTFNMNRSKNTPAKPFTEFLLFKPEDNRHIDDILRGEDW
jgi:hypothetical protein